MHNRSMVLSSIQHATRAPILLSMNKLAIEASINIPVGAENLYGADTDTDAEPLEDTVKNSTCDPSADFSINKTACDFIGRCSELDINRRVKSDRECARSMHVVSIVL